MKFGENLQKLRKERGISQEQLAEQLGVTRQSVSKWESGASYPEMDKIVAICNIFHCDTDVLINKDEICHPKAFDLVKDKNMIVFYGIYDSVSPITEMILPLWNLLEAHKTKALQKRIEYPTEHGLLGRRISTIKEIANFIANCP